MSATRTGGAFATTQLRLAWKPGPAGGPRLEALDLLPEGRALLAPGQVAELAEVVLGHRLGRRAVPVPGAGGPTFTPHPDQPAIPASALALESCVEAPDGRQLVLTLRAPEGGLQLRCTLSAAPEGALSLRFQARLVGLVSPLVGTVRLPFLQALWPGYPTPAARHLPEGTRLPDGRPLFWVQFPPGPFPLPYAVWAGEGEQEGVAVLARTAPGIAEPRPYWSPVPLAGVHARLRDEWLDVTELILAPFRGGWPGAFRAYRAQCRAPLDLREYHRPEQDWYRDQWVHHLTFAFSREIFNFETEALEVDRLLDEGERDFGGYDALLLWPQYPMLGLDQRTQWDFYDDLPGGRQGLAALARRARERGTRFFIPYLPWDDPPDERRTHRHPAAERLAEAVRDCEADGVFLDTMDSVPSSFRDALDAVRPSAVFCSERHPLAGSMEMITGSWAQDRSPYALDVDLTRFLFPEHPTFQLYRHAEGEARRQVLLRALFNGAGIVVWQDIFGEVMEFTAEDRALVRRVAGLLRAQAARFRGADAIPALPTLQGGLYANLFIAQDGRRALSLWNDSGTPLEGDLVGLPAAGAVGAAGSFQDAWGSARVQTRPAAGGRQVLGGRIPPELSVLVEAPAHAAGGPS